MMAQVLGPPAPHVGDADGVLDFGLGLDRSGHGGYLGNEASRWKISPSACLPFK